VQYREQVLVALREVDDQLSALRWLGEQAGALQATQDDADRAAALAQSRYERGLTSQLEVLEARTAAQRHRHAALQVQAARQQATVALVRALGGGWGDAPPPVAMRGL
jgi:multidrug efflux system outer membrane protein